MNLVEEGPERLPSGGRHDPSDRNGAPPWFWFDHLASLNETRCLDGNTGTGTVQLAKNTDLPFTGTRRLRSVPGDRLVFTCLGVSHGPRTLDGRPGPDSVQLRPHTDFPGTRRETVTPF
ncbi:hypothetical protein [Streptomyces sp. NRRL F-5727]|uniref:hypothetical protein n=1 Tax=Streptomyces sp. NRRL F-5727 TaxID=1463871 RepID=UPI0004CC04F7|nr:hypothetical protein [Streptomyces sp. NRRL F-5727]